ncbi:MAG: type secretion system protein GspH [Pseudomonadota bacterium]|jgi:general secretion pathway protein H
MLKQRGHGFTLIEVMVVMVIASLLVLLVSLKGLPSSNQALQEEARRIAQLLQLARDEAIVRNKPVAFEAEGQLYRFLVKIDGKWQPLTDVDVLRERSFTQSPISLSIDPRPTEPGNLRIVFGREPIDKPFVLNLNTEDNHVAIRADGLGNFVAE